MEPKNDEWGIVQGIIEDIHVTSNNITMEFEMHFKLRYEAMVWYDFWSCGYWIPATSRLFCIDRKSWQNKPVNIMMDKMGKLIAWKLMKEE